MWHQEATLEQFLRGAQPLLGESVSGSVGRRAKIALHHHLFAEHGEHHYPVGSDVASRRGYGFAGRLERYVCSAFGTHGGVAKSHAVCVGDTVEDVAQLALGEGADGGTAGRFVVIESFEGAEFFDFGCVARRAGG